MKSFVSKVAAPLAPLEFELDGDSYTFYPLKTSTLMMGMFAVNPKDEMAAFDRVGAMFDWLYAGLSRKHFKDRHLSFQEGCAACKLHGKLADPEDALDIDTVQEVINWLMTETSGRPTT